MSDRSRTSRVRDPLARVWRFFEAHDGAWRASTAGFERRDSVPLDGAPWIVIYNVHAIRSTRGRAVKLLSSITIWPPTATATAWRLACQREFRRHGYSGRWRESPYGRFADFWSKPLASAAAMPREVKRLDRLCDRVRVLSAPRPGSRRRVAGRAGRP